MCSREARVCPCKLIEIFGMINPLQTTKSGRGIVSVRVALLLRFTEIKPCSYDLFRLYNHFDLRHELIPFSSASSPRFYATSCFASFISIPCSSGAPFLHLLVCVCFLLVCVFFCERFFFVWGITNMFLQRFFVPVAADWPRISSRLCRQCEARQRLLFT